MVSDATTNVRVVFASSYDHLGTDGARLFRLLGTQPGPDIGKAAVASLAGTAADRTSALLAELTRAHLLTEHFPGRYTLHDLLRVYAAERVQAPRERCRS